MDAHLLCATRPSIRFPPRLPSQPSTSVPIEYSSTPALPLFRSTFRYVCSNSNCDRATPAPVIVGTCCAGTIRFFHFLVCLLPQQGQSTVVNCQNLGLNCDKPSLRISFLNQFFIYKKKGFFGFFYIFHRVHTLLIFVNMARCFFFLNLSIFSFFFFFLLRQGSSPKAHSGHSSFPSDYATSLLP